MTTSEKLKLMNEAVERVMRVKHKARNAAELMLNLEDGEQATVTIKCKGLELTMNRIEGKALYALVHNIVKIAHESFCTEQDLLECALKQTWDSIRG